MLELQRRLPSDRVSGTISFSATSTYQQEGSEVIIPCEITKHLDRPSLAASMSQDSCFSIEDHSALISLHATNSLDMTTDDIIPVVIATENDMSQDVATPTSPLDRQVSDPLPPNMIRQVLYGSSHFGGVAEEGERALLQRHRSLFTRGSHDRSHDSDTHSHCNSSLKRGLSEPSADSLPPSKVYSVMCQLSC